MYIRMIEIAENLGIQGTDLLTRPIGEKFYDIFLSKMEEHRPGSVLELDFEGIQTIDFSFADECLARLMEECVLTDRFGDVVCLMRNLVSNAALENLHIALDYYRKVCCFVVNSLTTKNNTANSKLPDRTGILSNQYYYILLGSLEERLYETLAFIIQHRQGTAREIADEFDLNISTASTRLLKLYKAHLLHRMEEVSPEGRQFAYRSPL